MLNDKKCLDKASAQKWVGLTKKRIMNNPVDLTLEQLARKATSGHTFICANLKHTEDDLKKMKQGKSVGASRRHWVSQELFGLDIDNEIEVGTKKDKRKIRLKGDQYLTLEKILDLCKKGNIHPAFIYTTFSHSEELNKFRIIFKASRVVSDLEERTKVMKVLYDVFTVDELVLPDPRCTDEARLFFPGQEVVYSNYEGEPLDIDSIVKAHVTKEELKKNSSSKAIKKSNEATVKEVLIDNEYVKFLRSMRVDSLIENEDFPTYLKGVSERVGDHSNPYGIWNARKKRETGTIHIIYNNNRYCSRNSKNGCNEATAKSTEGEISADITFPSLSFRGDRAFAALPEDYYSIVETFPFGALLGLPSEENISCVLPGHIDNNPSARISLIEHEGKKKYAYKCFGCMGEEYYDIFTFLEVVMGWSHSEAKMFINKVLNIAHETSWQKDKKLEISEYGDYILSSTSFAHEYPILAKELKKAKAYGILDAFLYEAKRMIYDKETIGIDEAIFFAGVRRIQNVLISFQKRNKYETYGTGLSSVHPKIKFLSRLGLIEPLKDESGPVKLIKQAHQERISNIYRYRLSFYKIPSFTHEMLDEAERRAIEMNSLGMKRAYYSRQMELFATEEKEADRVYVQDLGKGLSEDTAKFFIKITEVSGKLLEKGYFTEKELLSAHSIRKTKEKKKLLATVMPRLLQTLDIQKVRCNNYYREKFELNQVKNKMNSFIFIKSKDVMKK